MSSLVDDPAEHLHRMFDRVCGGPRVSLAMCQAFVRLLAAALGPDAKADAAPALGLEVAKRIVPGRNRLNRAAYDALVAEDVAWLHKQPRTLERDHIETMIAWATTVLYPDNLDPAARALLDRVAALEAVAKAWTEEWDCSAYPGHPGVCAAADALRPDGHDAGTCDRGERGECEVCHQRALARIDAAETKETPT